MDRRKNRSRRWAEWSMLLKAPKPGLFVCAKDNPASLRPIKQVVIRPFDLGLATDARSADGDAKARFWSLREDI